MGESPFLKGITESRSFVPDSGMISPGLGAKEDGAKKTVLLDGERDSRLGLHPLDMGAKTIELLVDRLIPAVNMIDTVDLRHAIGGQGRQH